MCNLPNVTPTLVICLADPELWAEFHLMKMGHAFFTDASWLAKVMYGGKKWLKLSKLIFRRRKKREEEKNIFSGTREHLMRPPSPLHQLGLVRLLKAAAVAKSNRVNKSFERRS